MAGTMMFKLEQYNRQQMSGGELSSSTSTLAESFSGFLEPSKRKTSAKPSLLDDRNNDNRDTFELHRTAARGQVDVMQELLRRGVSPDLRGDRNRTALMYAAWNGQAEAFDLLMSYGANMRLRDYDGNRAIAYAAGRGLGNMVEYILKRVGLRDENHYMEYARLIYIAYTGDVAALNAMKSPISSIDRINPEDQTPLHIASGNGYAALVEALINKGARVGVANHIRQTPLHWAAWNGHTEVVRVLLAHGASPASRSLGGVTPLMLAAQSNVYESVQLLLDKGADPELRDDEGRSALSIAESMGNADVAKLLRARIRSR